MRTGDGYIIDQCLKGDSAAFGLLVDKYKESIYALAYSKLGNFHDAEDVAQEVFIIAYEKLHTLKRWDNFYAWLYSITSNLCKMWWRSRSRRPDGEYIADQNRDVDQLSMDSYREDLMRESLREALASLPETHRQVLTLHYLGGMSCGEIARLLGTSPHAIEMRLSRARAQLKEEMNAMMSTTFEQHKLQPGFTIRIVELIKRAKIQPGPQAPAIPIGLSITAGLIFIALLNLTMPFNRLIPIGTLIGSPLPSEMKVAEVGEIPVDVVEVTEAPIFSSERGNGKLGGAPQPSNPLNAAFAAQGDEPRPPEGGWLNAPGKANAFAEAPDHPSLDQKIGNEFTIEAWVYLNKRPKANESWTVVSKPGSYSMEVFGWPDPLVTPVVKITVGGITVHHMINVGEWTHFAGVFKPNNGVGGFNAGIYRNGRLSFLRTPQVIKVANTDSPIRVGEHFVGAIDQIRVSKVARYTAIEQNPFKPPAEPFKPDEDTIALWQFEDGENAGQFRDDSGNGNHLIKQGDIQISQKPLENNLQFFDPNATGWFQETKLKFLAEGPGQNDIIMIDGERLSVRNLTATPKDIERDPSWSPDGKQIVFSKFEKLIGGAGEEDWNLYTMDVESGHRTQLTEGDARDRSPDWSPDGKEIMFASNREKAEGWDIYVLDVTTKKVQRLTDGIGRNGDPQWSPDGRQIAFFSNRSGNGEIHIMDSDGKRQRQLTNHRADIRDFSWAPDGKKLVYSIQKEDHGELFIANLATNKATRLEIEKLPANLWPAGLPLWLPDGQHIIFHGVHVYRVDVDGKNLLHILEQPHGHNFRIRDVYDPNHPPGASLPVEPVGVRLTTFGEVKRTALLQNFPNPFNPETWIPYRLASDASVSISIYDAHGSLIRQLQPGVQAAGSYLTPEKAAYWDGRDLHGEPVASGVYFYRLDAGDFTATRKMVVVK